MYGSRDGVVPDVIVVGAGPAGAIAALTLARAGVRVRLLDRAAFPRDKLCGDTLNPGSLAMLDRLRVGDRVREGALRTTGMTVTGPGGASVSADYPDGLCGIAIRRRDLDLRLIEAAVAAGVQFEPSATVQDPLFADDGRRVAGVRLRCGRRDVRLHSRAVVAADGRGSRLGARLGLSRFAAAPKRWAFGAYYHGVHGLTARGEMHIRPDGYLGVAPLCGGVANVCVVRTLPHCGPGHDRLCDDAIGADAGLRDRFRTAARASHVTVLGPLAVDADAAGGPGLLLAGDAAGFVDPMTGDGLRFAIRGGELAAEAALRELESGVPAFPSLTAARAREFGAKWRVNRALRALVGSPPALELAAVVARRWTAPVEYLIGVAGDVNLAR